MTSRLSFSWPTEAVSSLIIRGLKGSGGGNFEDVAGVFCEFGKLKKPSNIWERLRLVGLLFGFFGSEAGIFGSDLLEARNFASDEAAESLPPMNEAKESLESSIEDMKCNSDMWGYRESKVEGQESFKHG